LINTPKCPIPISKPPTSNFGLSSLNKRDTKLSDKGLNLGMSKTAIPIKEDSENSDADDKIEIVNVKNGKGGEGDSGNQR